MRHISVRAKYHLLNFVGWFAGGLALMVAGMMIHWAIAVAVLPYAIVLTVLLLRLRCPGCRRRIATQAYLLGPYVGKRCRYCGHDLTSQSRETGQGRSEEDSPSGS